MLEKWAYDDFAFAVGNVKAASMIPSIRANSLQKADYSDRCARPDLAKLSQRE